MRKLTTLIICAALTLLTASTAAASTKPACRVPNLKGDTLAQARHKLAAAHCELGKIAGAHGGKVTTQIPRAGRKEKPGTKVAVTLQRMKISYKATVDPTFVQDPTNPLQVTYTYDADAVEVANGNTENLGQIGQLPAGILNFYSQGTLECSMNVGGAVYSGTCTVTYPNTGTYTVETQYIPNGVTAVLETDQETIEPFSTTVDLATAAGPVQGTYFDVGVAWDVQSTGGVVATTAIPTYTIIDSTTGQTVGTWTGSSTASSCYIVSAASSGSTLYFNGGTCWNGDSGNVSSSDSYELEVTFPGQVGYTGSTSPPAPV